jgi:hypothetical protein
MWLGDEDADRSTTKLGEQLLGHQIDFDYFDEQSLSSVASLEKDGFRNLSGQVYRAVIVPSSVVISRASLDRLRAFAAQGGKVVFIGRTPDMVVEKSFLHPAPKPDLSFAQLEPSGDLTEAVIAVLPKPDFALAEPNKWIRYNHRAWRDGDLYFIFNRSNKEQSITPAFAGRGQAQAWDLATGQIHPIRDVHLPLVLEPYEAKVIVIGPAPPDMAVPEPVLSTRQTIQELAGDWSFNIDGKTTSTPLRSWQDLGIATLTGPGVYRKEFAVVRKPAGKQLLLEIGDIRDYADVKLNGVELAARAWQPWRWDVKRALRAGPNVLEIEVRAVPAGRGPAPVPQVSGLLGPVRLVSSE